MTDPDDDPTPPRDPIPEPPAAPVGRTAFHDVLWFLGQCRQHNYQVRGPIKYGELVVQVVDVQGAPAVETGDIWSEHGYQEGR